MSDPQESGVVTGPRQAGHGAGPQAGAEPVGRRKLLAWLTGVSLALAGAVASGQLARFLSFQPAAGASERVTAGVPADLTSGTPVYHAGARAYLGRDEGGLYAVDALCTHLGCLVEHDLSGDFVCPCHGSRFSPEGKVRNGPANQNLHYLGLEVSPDGTLIVDRSRQVTPITRLVIPA